MNNAFRQSERIYFRPLELEDLEILQGWMNNPEVHRHLLRDRPLSRAEEREWLESLHKKEGLFAFGIALKENGALIGTCSLKCGERPHRAAELGIALGEPKLHGKGYGTEAIRLLLEYGFATLNLHRISLSVFSPNLRAIRCYERCGFRREGVQREALWSNGGWCHSLQYGILESEWRTHENQ